MTDNGRVGRISLDTEDFDSFAKELAALCLNPDYLARNFHEMRSYMKEFFDYEHLAVRLQMLVQLQSLKRSHS